MAQAQLMFKPIMMDHTTQTGDLVEFYVNLAKTKTLHMYWSKSYKDYVICLSFSNNKNYIITRQMWKIFREHIIHIDNAFNQ